MSTQLLSLDPTPLIDRFIGKTLRVGVFAAGSAAFVFVALGSDPRSSPYYEKLAGGPNHSNNVAHNNNKTTTPPD